MRTVRLLLRRWRPEDRKPFAALNADPEVMRYMPRPLTGSQSDHWVDEIERGFEQDGFGLWALELPGDLPFIGFTGLNRVPFDAHFTPAVEIGWRLSPAFWGQGYAIEAARAVVGAGFEAFGLDEIVAETAATNLPSRRVMDRLGMRHDTAGDFINPCYESDSKLVRHVLYRLPKA